MSEINPEVPGEAPPEVPSAAESEGWAPPSQQEWEQLARAYMESQHSLMNAAAYIEQQMAQPADMQPDPADVDLGDDEEELTPEAFKRMVAEAAGEAVQNALSSNPHLQQLSEQRGEAIADQTLGQIAQQIGGFDTELAKALAQTAYSRGMPAEQALQAGAQAAKQYGDQRDQAAIQAYQESLRRNIQAPAEVPTTGAAEEGRPNPKSYDEVNKVFFARRNAQQALN